MVLCLLCTFEVCLQAFHRVLPPRAHVRSVAHWSGAPRPAGQSLNVQCTEDCPASVHGEIASSISRPVVLSAAVPHSTVATPASTDFNKPHGLLLLSSCRLASLPVTKTWSSPTVCFQSYRFLGSSWASEILWSNLWAFSHCFAVGVILAGGKVMLPSEFSCFPVPVSFATRGKAKELDPAHWFQSYPFLRSPWPSIYTWPYPWALPHWFADLGTWDTAATLGKGSQRVLSLVARYRRLAHPTLDIGNICATAPKSDFVRPPDGSIPGSPDRSSLRTGLGWCPPLPVGVLLKCCSRLHLTIYGMLLCIFFFNLQKMM